MLKKFKMFKAHDIYHKSPVFMQHVFTSTYGYKLKRERYGPLYREALNRYIDGGFDKEKSMLAFLNHLKSNIAVYEDIEIDENDVMAGFLKLPFTYKEQLREGLEERSHKKGIIRHSVTSGTTGANLIVYDSEYDRADRMAYLDYIKFINGVEPFSKRASFTGQDLTPVEHKEKMWRYNHPMRQMLYATRCITPGNIHKIYESMKRFRPVSIDGIPSALHMVAKYMLKHGLKADWDIKGVFPTAEILYPNVKQDLEAAFDAVVIDQYSSAEGAPFIYSDPDGGYNIAHETGLVEFFKVESGIYEMVVTSFINHATPIVRYKIKDQVEMDSNLYYMNSFQHDCPLRRIIGRGGDFLYTTEGNKVRNIIVAWIADGLEAVVSHQQFVQKSLDEITINMVVEEGYTDEDEKVILERMRKMFGSGIHVLFNYVDSIPKENNGKTRMIINEVGEAVA